MICFPFFHFFNPDDEVVDSPWCCEACLKPLLQRIRTLSALGLTGNGVIASFIRRQVQPLREREHFGFEYTGSNDPSRLPQVDGFELFEDIVENRLRKIVKDVPVMPVRV